MQITTTKTIFVQIKFWTQDKYYNTTNAMKNNEFKSPRYHSKPRWKRSMKGSQRLDGNKVGFRYPRPKEDDEVQDTLIDLSGKTFNNSGHASFRSGRRFGQQTHGSNTHRSTGRKLKELNRSSAQVKSGQKVAAKSSNKESNKKSKKTINQGRKSSGKKK